MERRPQADVAREQLLRIQEAKYTLRPTVPPISLERKYISMLNPSTPSQASTTTTTTDMTASTTVSSPTSSSPTSATAVPRVALPSSAMSATLVPTTAASAAAAVKSRTSSIVGGKRPLGEESPIIIFTHHQDKKGNETSSDMPESEVSLSRNQPEKEQPHHRKTKPEVTARTLSTEQPTSERGRDLGRQKSKQGVQFSEVSPKRDVTHVMQFFQEQEKSLQESFLSLPKKSQKKQRSPSPKWQQAAGLEHLDNLIRLMEQLTTLKDENSRLRKRCDYLESTKMLLQVKRDLSFESSSSSSGVKTLPPKQKHHHHHHQEDEKGTPSFHIEPLHHRETGRISRARISSADELEYLELADSSSDQTPKKPKTAMHKRSFSTGSLEVPSEITTEIDGVETRKRKDKSIFGKSSGAKQKTKSSKWARVKKVLTGQKIYEDLGTTIRTIRELGRSSHVRYSTSGTHEFSSASSRISSGEVKHPETGVGRGHEVYGARAPLPVASTFVTETSQQRYQEEEDADLTSEIWMGPPGWWEEYEARKESGETSTNSECSVIEVTTMYLGSKKEPATSTTVSTAPSLTTSVTMSQEKFLTIDKPLSRRQSSPSLVMKEGDEEEDILKELASSVESTRVLHKSSSCKSADLDIQNFGESKQPKKSHRSAWGRVKDIIHTRKDSIKKRPKRGKSGIDSEETSEMDVEGLLEEHQWRSDVFDEGLIGRSTPKSSPMVVRQQSVKHMSESYSGAFPKTSPSRGSSYHPGTSPENVDVASLLAGTMSDEFSKKMQEWEQIKSKKSSFRVSMDESDIGSLDVSGVSHDFPVRTIDLRDLRGKIPEIAATGISPEESSTSMEVLKAPSINVEEMQRRMTDSFSRKMQEWERLKYKATASGAREPSPDIERKETKSRKDDRHKSKRSREEKEKEKWERQREREIQKVEREQIKLEKEKLRIEKERQRAMEREAKLERLKGRLSQAEAEGRFKSPVISPLAEYKVTADFARKLHEWELKKGLSHDVSNSIYLEAQQMGMQHLTRGGRISSLNKQEESRYNLEGPTRSPGSEKAPPPPPLTLQPYWDSPEDTSPIEKYSEGRVPDGDDDTCTSVTEECLTTSKINTLERANRQLLENLQRKELEYEEVQDEVQKVNEKLAKVRENHAAEMARFHRELAKGNISGPVKLEVGELETTMGDLEEKIKLMENFGEKMASSMESAAIGKWQSIEGEETVHTQLVELVDQMRGMLLQASQSEEQSQKTMALSNFETLYTQAMKLQVQMNNLRLSHLERNREIMMIKRQLLLQEVNNLLLQADITRRETELYQFQEAKRFASLKRWNTFSGTERQRPSTQVELTASSMKPASQREARTRPTETPHINIPHLPEELTLASAVSSSKSAPASPFSIAAAGSAAAPQPSSTAGPLHFNTGISQEQSTDRTETLLTPSYGKPSYRIGMAEHTSVAQQPTKESATAGGVPELPASLHLPKVSIHAPSRQLVSAEHLTDSTEGPAVSSVSTASTSGSTDIIETSPTLATTGRIPLQEKQRQKIQSGRSTITTICDSAPIHIELRELRREKRKVEKGPPTLKITESERLSSVPSPEKVSLDGRSLEAPNQSIPKQQSLAESGLVEAAQLVDNDNFPATSVMECTDKLHILELTDSELGAVGGVNLPPQAALTTRQDFSPPSDRSSTGSTSSRSPVSQRIVRYYKEERDTKYKDYHAISPKGSPIAARGKPPLPRHITPTKHPPSASHATEKGPRSKSVSDMDERARESTVSKPLQEAISRFDKRATVCETEDRPIELRKTPSPTLHLPRVGLVSRVRRLKPAAELLEESQRYRSGHSIYATRIMQRYLPKDDHRPDHSKMPHDKENVSGTYVQTMVQRLSRETTPVRSEGSSRTNSDLSLKRTDSLRARSDFVAEIVRTLSSPGEPETHKSAAPFKDLTNEGQVKKMTQTFNGHTQTKSQDRTLSDSNIDKSRETSSTAAMKVQHRKSCEVALVLGSSGMPTSEASYLLVSSTSSESAGDSSQKPDSAISPVSCQSLPTIVAPSSGIGGESAEEAARGRAATYCVSEMDKPKVKGRDESAITQSSSAKPQTREELRKKASQFKEKGGRGSKEASGKLPSSLSPDRRGAGRGKMGTVGVLCKQSISFDLGVTLYSQQIQEEEKSAPKARQARSWDPSEAAAAGQAESTATAVISPIPTSSTSESTASGETRPTSTSSEGEVAPSSPTTAEKKRSRRFLDSSWLQRSKNFFKVSK